MLQLHMLRLFVEQRLSAVTDDIFRRFAAVITEYEREVLRLKLELSKQQSQPKARGQPGDAAGHRPQEERREPLEEQNGEQPAGVVDDFPTEEKPQVKAWSFSPQLKLEEGASPGREDAEIDFQSAVGQVSAIKQEVDDDDMLMEMNPNLEGDSFLAEDDDQVRPNFSLHVLPEEDRALGSEDAELSLNPDWHIKRIDEDGSPAFNRNHSYGHDDSLLDSSETLSRPPDHRLNSNGELDLSSDGDVLDCDPSALASQTRPVVRKIPFTCSSCGREFSSKTSLRKHVRRYNGKDQDQLPCSLQRQKAPYQRSSTRFSCKVCGSSFYTQGILLRHAESHCKEPDSLCGVCGEHLQSAQTLTEHLQSHKELGITCDVCGKKWSSMKRMEIHKRIHTGEKPYRCGFCSLDFSRRESLVRHLKLHSGEQPHRCGLCRKSFTRREYLIQHLDLIHKMVK
ncbi:zinc finger protein 391 isoform X1 [Oryzias melastigma]|uniref:zinc finger protein 391 isoform X1 n=1 Tax=Oryzias melastigma TaxID=30732 RepID=UPI000CF7EB99|nr:zinc finger protein 391 isoform X1 [Oryzias melastigma]